MRPKGKKYATIGRAGPSEPRRHRSERRAEAKRAEALAEDVARGHGQEREEDGQAHQPGPV